MRSRSKGRAVAAAVGLALVLGACSQDAVLYTDPPDAAARAELRWLNAVIDRVPSPSGEPWTDREGAGFCYTDGSSFADRPPVAAAFADGPLDPTTYRSDLEERVAARPEAKITDSSDRSISWTEVSGGRRYDLQVIFRLGPDRRSLIQVERPSDVCE